MRFARPLAIVPLAALLAAAAAAQPSPGGEAPGFPEAVADAALCADAGAADAGATCVVLYTHFLDLLNGGGFLIVQLPHPECPDGARGFTSTPTVGPFFNQSHAWLVPSAAFVEYGGGCETLFHPEQGHPFDIEVAPDVPLFVHWYLSADTDDVSVVADPDTPDTGAMPCVTVRATLFEGRKFYPGDVLAAGESSRTILSSRVAPARTMPREDPCVSGLAAETHPLLEVAPAQEFPIALGPLGRALNASESFSVLVEWWQVRTEDPPLRAAQREWNIHSGYEFRNRLVLPVLDPFRVVDAHASVHPAGVLVTANVSSALMVGDFDAASLRLDVYRPDGVRVGAPHLERQLFFAYHGHGTFPPTKVAWGWDHGRDGAGPGLYRFEVSGLNWQHSDEARASLQAYLPPPEGASVPGPAAILVILAALSGAALAARWKRA